MSYLAGVGAFECGGVEGTSSRVELVLPDGVGSHEVIEQVRAEAAERGRPLIVVEDASLVGHIALSPVADVEQVLEQHGIDVIR